MKVWQLSRLVAVSGTLALAACGHASPQPTSARAENLPVTEAIRSQLVAAAAKFKHVSASDFVGLAKGLTYYAFDPATKTYWAGAALRPRSGSESAGVSVQDEGSYTLFHRSVSGPWAAFDTGPAGGPIANPSCGAWTPPATVLALWGWPPHSCHAPGA